MLVRWGREEGEGDGAGWPRTSPSTLSSDEVTVGMGPLKICGDRGGASLARATLLTRLCSAPGEVRTAGPDVHQGALIYSAHPQRLLLPGDEGASL